MIQTKTSSPPTWWRVALSLVTLLYLTSCAVSPSGPVSNTPTGVSPSPTPQAGFAWKGTERPLLMAHYMPWYQSAAAGGSWGWHWTMDHFTPTQQANGAWENFASHYTPLVGLYDSGDEAVLEYQVQTMKFSGIDGVIVDWYGPEDFWDYAAINANTDKLFQAIKKAGMKFVICYEDATVKNMVENDHLKGEEALAHGQKVMAYLQDTWFDDEAYLKVDGQPVLFTFGPQYFKADDWKALFSGFAVQPLFITLDGHTVPAQSSSYPWPPMWIAKGGELTQSALANYLDSFYSKSSSASYLVGGAFPGFHDIYQQAGTGSSYGFLDAQDGKTFRFTLQKALDQQPDLIQVITWNDYGEGTNIEPTVEFQYRYLEILQEARAATGSFTYSGEDLRLPLELYQARVSHAADRQAAARLNEASSALLTGDIAAARKILGEFR